MLLLVNNNPLDIFDNLATVCIPFVWKCVPSEQKITYNHLIARLVVSYLVFQNISFLLFILNHIGTRRHLKPIAQNSITNKNPYFKHAINLRIRFLLLDIILINLYNMYI